MPSFAETVMVADLREGSENILALMSVVMVWSVGALAHEAKKKARRRVVSIRFLGLGIKPRLESVGTHNRELHAGKGHCEMGMRGMQGGENPHKKGREKPHPEQRRVRHPAVDFSAIGSKRDEEGFLHCAPQTARCSGRNDGGNGLVELADRLTSFVSARRRRSLHKKEKREREKCIPKNGGVR